MSDQIDWTSLDRYFSGESTMTETDAIERWASESAAHAEELARARRIWAEAARSPRRFDAEAAKRKVHAQMAATTRPHVARPLRLAMPGSGRRSWAIAAGLAALLVGAATWHIARRSPPTIADARAGQTYVTANGQRREFALSDGTRIMLGPGSRLIVAAQYGVGARDVRLEGEGYFEVEHDERRPFAVYAGGAIARDLGTKFVVRAYSDAPGVRVAVAEGEVAFDTTVLFPRQVGERASNGAIAVRRDVDVDPYFAWTTGKLVFEDTPLADALPELSRWYAVQFELADSSLAGLPLSGTLGDRLNSETLDLLAVLLSASIEQRDNRIIIGRTQP